MAGDNNEAPLVERAVEKVIEAIEKAPYVLVAAVEAAADAIERLASGRGETGGGEEEGPRRLERSVG